MSNMTPTIGLIVPPAAGLVPSDGQRLYDGRAHFIARGLGLDEVSPSGFKKVVEHIMDRALELRDAGASTISLMGTSLSFYRGAAFTDDLRARMQEATGLPCTTMSHAIVRAMRSLGIRRVAVATSYIDELNNRLKDFLGSHNIEVTALRGLSILGVDAVGKVPESTLIELSEAVYRDDPSADGLFISCGGLITLDILAPLEAKLDIPATSSSPAGFWDVMKVAGLDSSAEGFGRMFT